MTGGQSSPLTPQNCRSTTAPFGHIERSFDIAKLSVAAGATYVARGTSFHAKMLTDLIAKGIANKGFSVIDAISGCPTSFGRKNKMSQPAKMLEWQRDHAVTVQAAAKLSAEQLADKFLIGELHQEAAPEFTDEYAKVVERLKGGRA